MTEADRPDASRPGAGWPWPRRARHATAALLLAAALASCSPRSEPAATTPAPADIPATSAGPAATFIPDSLELQALGNEPFWSVSITNDAMVYRDPEQQDGIVFPAPQRLSADGGWVYRSSRTATVPARVEVMIQEAPCSDGMSDTRYRFTAHAHLDERHLDGCARLRPRSIPPAASAPR